MWIDEAYRGRGYARELLNSFVAERNCRRRMYPRARAPGIVRDGTGAAEEVIGDNSVPQLDVRFPSIAGQTISRQIRLCPLCSTAKCHKRT